MSSHYAATSWWLAVTNDLAKRLVPPQKKIPFSCNFSSNFLIQVFIAKFKNFFIFFSTFLWKKALLSNIKSFRHYFKFKELESIRLRSNENPVSPSFNSIVCFHLKPGETFAVKSVSKTFVFYGDLFSWVRDFSSTFQGDLVSVSVINF